MGREGSRRELRHTGNDPEQGVSAGRLSVLSAETGLPNDGRRRAGLPTDPGAVPMLVGSSLAPDNGEELMTPPVSRRAWIVFSLVAFVGGFVSGFVWDAAVTVLRSGVCP